MHGNMKSSKLTINLYLIHTCLTFFLHTEMIKRRDFSREVEHINVKQHKIILNIKLSHNAVII